MPEPVLLPPFFPDLIDPPDPGFPVRITLRCSRKLFWHIANMEPYFGPALRITKPVGGTSATVLHCDVSEIAPEAHQVTSFSGVKVGIPWDQVDKLQGWVLDLRSFPPGKPILLMVPGRQTDDDFPARLQLDLEKTRLIQPQLFQVPSGISRGVAGVLRIASQFGSGLAPDGWIDRMFGIHDPDGQAEALESLAMRLWHFHVEPVVMLDAERGRLAAYSSSTDAVMLLAVDPRRGAECLNQGKPLERGQRFLAIFGYDRADDPSGDLVPGPFTICEFNEGWPVLVDWLVSDHEGLARAKPVFRNIFGSAARTWGNSGWRRVIPPGTPAPGIRASASGSSGKAD